MSFSGWLFMINLSAFSRETLFFTILAFACWIERRLESAVGGFYPVERSAERKKYPVGMGQNPE